MISRQRLERDFFRALNTIVEPAVRNGIGSFRFAPSTLVVLETIGFKSGKQRRTPLIAVRLGKHLLISTIRGDRSFWVKNLENTEEVVYHLGGRRYSSQPVLIGPGVGGNNNTELPPYLEKIYVFLERFTSIGWAFAIL